MPPASSSTARSPLASTAWRNAGPSACGQGGASPGASAGARTVSRSEARATSRMRASASAFDSKCRFRRWSKPNGSVCCHAVTILESTSQRVAKGSTPGGGCSEAPPGRPEETRQKSAMLNRGRTKAKHQAFSSSPQVSSWPTAPSSARASRRHSSSNGQRLTPAAAAEASPGAGFLATSRIWSCSLPLKAATASSIAAAAGVPGSLPTSKAQRRQAQGPRPKAAASSRRARTGPCVQKRCSSSSSPSATSRHATRTSVASGESAKLEITFASPPSQVCAIKDGKP
mmetsp:Transcript_125204/g.401059  ORF Transcript_125204/g.401059 Transcript_125204/m.401059 type:complete len:286 (+) Transcript_125204:1056-1913(+)